MSRTDTEDDSGVEELTDSLVREIVSNARSLSPDDERVTLVASVHDVENVSEFEYSSGLFTADVVSTSRVPGSRIAKGCERGELHVHLEKPAHFEGYGDGYLRFGITTTEGTREVEAVSVSRTLSAETVRRLAENE